MILHVDSKYANPKQEDDITDDPILGTEDCIQSVDQLEESINAEDSRAIDKQVTEKQKEKEKQEEDNTRIETSCFTELKIQCCDDGKSEENTREDRVCEGVCGEFIDEKKRGNPEL